MVCVYNKYIEIYKAVWLTEQSHGPDSIFAVAPRAGVHPPLVSPHTALKQTKKLFKSDVNE